MIDVCCAAQYKFGLGPIELAGWRHYSAIGLGEMAQFRDRLLAEPPATQKKIEAEYKGATVSAEQMLGRLLPDMTRNLEIAEAIRAVATPHSDTRAFRRVTD